jgi:hypothetical protein
MLFEPAPQSLHVELVPQHSQLILISLSFVLGRRMIRQRELLFKVRTSTFTVIKIY